MLLCLQEQVGSSFSDYVTMSLPNASRRMAKVVCRSTGVAGEHKSLYRWIPHLISCACSVRACHALNMLHAC